MVLRCEPACHLAAPSHVEGAGGRGGIYEIFLNPKISQEDLINHRNIQISLHFLTAQFLCRYVEPHDLDVTIVV